MGMATMDVETKNDAIWMPWLVERSRIQKPRTDGVTFMKGVKKADGTTFKIIPTIQLDDAIVATNDD